jgi:2',3'-cyclic-nucleotide 2'-phosphodiesterase (5'-nucleotidase family)
MRFKWSAFLLLLAASCSQPHVISKQETKSYVFSDSTAVQIDSSIEKEIGPYREKVQSEMSGILATSTSPIERGNPESKLGNLMSDACMDQASKLYKPSDGKAIDFAIFNNGGLRRPLPKGPITRGDVFELMPFENELVVISMTGDRIEKLVNFIASKGGTPVSGLRLTIDGLKAANVQIGGMPFDSTRTYKVLTSDYLANGGDSYDFFIGAPKENTMMKVRDAIINYLIEQTSAGKVIDVKLDQRIENAR